jgi:uncharacterized membrane protein YfcA
LDLTGKGKTFWDSGQAFTENGIAAGREARTISMPHWLVLIVIGLIGGFASGLFGIGGGTVIVPLLIYWAGFTQHKATGTSLAVLLPPIGLAAAFEYYRHGNVDVRAAMILATMMIAGSWAGANVANRLPGPHLRLAFGLFISGLGVYLVYGACKRLGWH